MKRIFQDTEARLDWAIDWANFLEVGEAIASQQISVPGVTVSDTSINATKVIFWMDSLTDGSFLGDCKILTNQGRENRYSFYVDVGRSFIPQ